MSKSRPPPKKPSVRPPKKEHGSDTMTVFLDACVEVIEALESLGVERLPDDDQGRALLSEARDIVTFLQAWKVKPPASADRRAVVERILRMHARAAIYLEKRRPDVVGTD